MAYKFDTEARYLDSHEWVRMEGDLAVIGISDPAQDMLSDVVYVELPEVGQQVTKGDAVAVVESVKAAEDVYAPLSGRIAEVNASLEDEPEVINQDPYGEGWFFKIEPEDPSELESLMDANGYAELVEKEGH